MFDRAFVHAIETSANPVSGLSGSGGDDKNNADEPIKMSGMYINPVITLVRE